MSPANLFSRLPVQNFGILTLGMSSVILFTRWIGVRTSKRPLTASVMLLNIWGRYTHRIAITNTRIQSVTDTHVSFAARDYKSGETKTVTLENKEFYPTFPYACVTVRLPENPLLWFSEQPHEVGKFKNHLQTTRISKIQTTVYRTFGCGTSERSLEL